MLHILGGIIIQANIKFVRTGSFFRTVGHDWQQTLLEQTLLEIDGELLVLQHVRLFAEGSPSKFLVQQQQKRLVSVRALFPVSQMTHKVFVYGTLKRNEPNHHWLTNPEHGVGKFIAEGTTKTKYPLIIGTKYNIPFLLYSPGVGHYVKGEVYEVDEAMLGNLDILEDHPNYYVRELDDIIVSKSNTSNQETIKCWVYFLKNFRPELLSKPQLDNYSSSGSHGLRYLERSKRDPNDNYYPEVKR